MTKILTKEEVEEYIDRFDLEHTPIPDLYYHRLSGNYIKLQKDADGNYIDDVLAFDEKQVKLKYITANIYQFVPNLYGEQNDI